MSMGLFERFKRASSIEIEIEDDEDSDSEELSDIVDEDDDIQTPIQTETLSIAVQGLRAGAAHANGQSAAVDAGAGLKNVGAANGGSVNNLNINRVNLSSNCNDRISQELLQEFRNTEDLTQLGQITLENVLCCLMERFHSKQYYTFAGSVLISLNPCLNVSRQSLGDLGNMMQYKERLDEEDENSERLAPHVYAIGLRSLKNIRTVGNNQIIVVSGDSGAGKTTCTQQLIRYLTDAHAKNESSNHLINNLDKKIYFATVILESFGNASTAANPNSSRFGRLVQLSYDRDKNICGAGFKTYLLEKHRAACAVGNYMIFNFNAIRDLLQLLKALQSGCIKIQDISGDCNNNYEEMLPMNLLTGVRESDCEDFVAFSQALKVLNLSEDFLEIIRVIFAIMHLIDIGFMQQRDEEDYDSDTFEDSMEQQVNNKEFTVTSWNRDRVATACSILGLDEVALVDAFVARKITAAANRRHSIFRKPCERESECEERANSFVTSLYDKLFAHVLSKVNGLLQQLPEACSINSSSSNFSEVCGDVVSQVSFVSLEEVSNSKSLTTLSLLDLYGFENLEFNHLEQLCINYANERLQEVQISTLKNYFKQQANLDEIDAFEESSELIRVEGEICQRIEELHVHLFSVLDEECLLKRCTSDKAIFERIALATKTDKFISVGRPHETECPFIVKHYAMNVTYHMSGMPDKNKDYIPPEFGELFDKSTNSFIRSLFQMNSDFSGTASNTPRNKNKNEHGKTILTRFKNSVKKLVSELQNDGDQDVHFIRCIRPNTELIEGKIQPNIVKNQLYSCGIVDIVRIAGNGYPIRIKLAKFKKEFPKFLKCFFGGKIDGNLLTLVFSFPNRPLKVGSAVIFMNEKTWKFLKKFENFTAQSSAKRLQCGWRNYRNRQRVIKSVMKTPMTPTTSAYYCGDSINATTYWFTPATHPNNSQYFSTPVARPGPFGDSTAFSDALDISMSSGESIGHNETKDNESLLQDSTFKSQSNTVRNTCLLVAEREPLVSLFKLKDTFIFGDGIVSKSPVHTLPIKFYTKKTALGFVRHPRRLVANGLQDAFEDYGVITYPNV